MNRSDPPHPVHIPGTVRGEQLVRHGGREPGRCESGSHGYRSARDSTSLNPQKRDPIDPEMPSIPPA